MKQKILTFLLLGIMLLGLTGCSNESIEDNKKIEENNLFDEEHINKTELDEIVDNNSIKNSEEVEEVL